MAPILTLSRPSPQQTPQPPSHQGKRPASPARPWGCMNDDWQSAHVHHQQLQSSSSNQPSRIYASARVPNNISCPAAASTPAVRPGPRKQQQHPHPPPPPACPCPCSWRVCWGRHGRCATPAHRGRGRGVIVHPGRIWIWIWNWNWNSSGQLPKYYSTVNDKPLTPITLPTSCTLTMPMVLLSIINIPLSMANRSPPSPCLPAAR